MKLRGIVLALALLMPASAFAGPVSLGTPTWSAIAPAGSGIESLTVNPFWSGLSWDCGTCGVGYLINAYGTANMEYLNDGTGKPIGFRFDDESVVNLSLLGTMTAWTNSTFGIRSDGAFTYDSGTGRVSNSWDNGEQYALFRLVTPQTTRYFLGIEDILLTELYNDRDYNDYIVSFETRPVPEPSALLLMLGAAGVAMMRRRQGRIAVSR